MRPEEFTWAAVVVADAVFLLQNEIYYCGSLLLHQTKTAINLYSESDSHADMCWKHAMNIARVVHVRNVQKPLRRLLTYCVTFVDGLQENKRNSELASITSGTLADPPGQCLPIHRKALTLQELLGTMTRVKRAGTVRRKRAFKGLPCLLRNP